MKHYLNSTKIKKLFLLTFITILSTFFTYRFSPGYAVGDMVRDFEAKNVIKLAASLDDQKWPLIAINSNDKGMSPGDSYDKMKDRAKSKKYSFPYIYDESQSILNQFGATKTPHFYLLDKTKKVRYIGALDDNSGDADNVTKKYVEDAIAAIKAGKDPNPTFTRAIGCSIKKRST